MPARQPDPGPPPAARRDPPRRDLGEWTWPEVSAAAARSVLAVPVGATEQHGPHLPLATDTLLAEALARRLAATRPDVLVAPAVAYGASGEHAAFAGTLSIGQAGLELVLTELARSADAFAGVLYVSAHGGNREPLERAVTTLRREGRQVRSWAPEARPSAAGPGPDGAPADAHAGHTETSLLLALHPGQVRMGRAEPGNVAPLGELWGELRTRGVAAVSPNGVLGDPTGAHAGAGRRLLDALTQDLVAAVAGWPPLPAGGSPPPAAPVEGEAR